MRVKVGLFVAFFIASLVQVPQVQGRSLPAIHGYHSLGLGLIVRSGYGWAVIPTAPVGQLLFRGPELFDAAGDSLGYTVCRLMPAGSSNTNAGYVGLKRLATSNGEEYFVLTRLRLLRQKVDMGLFTESDEVVTFGGFFIGHTNRAVDAILCSFSIRTIDRHIIWQEMIDATKAWQRFASAIVLD